jgi:hypothetical protein
MPNESQTTNPQLMYYNKLAKIGHTHQLAGHYIEIYIWLVESEIRFRVDYYCKFSESQHSFSRHNNINKGEFYFY